MADNDREIFERLRAIETSLARIEASLTHITPRCTDHEQRLRALEAESARRKGILAAVGTVGGVIGSGFAWLLKTIFSGGN